MDAILETSLSAETQRRYLNYALSVITARALPDVRDGLKPVQRRILYTMQNELRLRWDAKYVKCARIVGDVMGKFHPHGDSSIYDALVRLAQSFTMSAPLVDGRGNFGSPDGDGAAAMRYTEARLSKLASELLSELSKKTVSYRPNYDGQFSEPVVLPARFPNLLVNGSQGIAVGMATSIPPHNLKEVIDACVALIDDKDANLTEVLKHIKGPDFPTGGQLLSTKRELREVYETGQGSLKLRADYKVEEAKKGNPSLVVTSIPYSVERKSIVEKIAEVIISKKLPVLLDVRDESTEQTRIVCEFKAGTDPQLVMAYLYKQTPLAVNVQVNLTCLVPVVGSEVAAPQRLDLLSILRHFLDFRMDVVTKRLTFDLEALRARIHILEAFEKIFDVLDETIKIIRASEGKADAAQKLMKRFSLDAEQVDAILELKLYRLAKLEILVIQKELGEKRSEADRLEKLLKSPAARWKLIRAELLELSTEYAPRRRTRVLANVDEPAFQAEDFIVEEDGVVVLTEQGWIKRQREIKDLSTTRLREGDRVIDVVAGSTKSAIAFFSNQGVCYVCRFVDVPQVTGYGNPVQTLFKLDDGEKLIKALSFDPRLLEVPEATPDAEPEPPLALAVTRSGQSLRFSLRPHRDPSTKAGRKYARLSEGDQVIYIDVMKTGDYVAAASESGHALICRADQVAVLGSAGKGVMLMKLEDGDVIVGAKLLRSKSDQLNLENEKGTGYDVTLRKYDAVTRGGKGHALFKRGKLVGKVAEDPELPTLPESAAPNSRRPKPN
ncbi:MAG TPA: DNA topoisomerase IV subunit A [Polyangiales bacterium]|nr:DNA topoisomerase IV subunit A [Polyangiales bacterium]